MTNRERNKILERVACEGFDVAIRGCNDIEDEEFQLYRNSYISAIAILERYCGI